MATFTLKPVPPFRLDLTVSVLRRLPINEMDRWDGQAYRRVLMLGGSPVTLEVRQSGSLHEPELVVSTKGKPLGRGARGVLVTTLEKMLGLNIDLTPFHRMAEKDRRLATLVRPFHGFKPPCLPSLFETLLNGIACQQLSLSAGVHLLNRLCRAFASAVGEEHAFTRPEDLVAVAPSELRTLGFSTRKAQAMLDIAQCVVMGRLDLEGLSALDDAAVLERLLQLKGVGRWTAQYVLLRGLGRLDVFPADDVGGQAKLQRWLGRKERPDYDEVYRIVAPWRPYRGLMYFYLLLDNQARQGILGSGCPGVESTSTPSGLT